MKDQLFNLIKGTNWKTVLDFLDQLSIEDRYKALGYLMHMDINQNLLGQNGFDLKGVEREKFFDNRKKISSCRDIAILACTRNKEELKQAINEFGLSEYGQLSNCLATPDLGHEPIIQFFKKYPPNYLDGLIKKIAKERFSRIDFKILWKLYENDWISFDEELFVRSLFIVHMFDRSTVADANFLIDHPKAFEMVFLQFYKYELPVLDISKWQGRYDFQCAKVNTFWTEVLEIFLEKNIKIPRTLVKHLLESLLNNWKKPHLNWHISLIKLLAPTKAEYLKHQKLIFAFLNSDNIRTLNFTVEILGLIHKEKEFDHAALIASAPTLFIREKVDKTLSRLLPIVEFSLDNNQDLKKDIPQQLSLGLLQVNTHTQSKFAKLLVKYTPKADVATWVEPYTSVLKIKALEILGVEKQVEETEVHSNKKEELQPISPPQNWEDLLFHIGTCINTKSACDIDLFFEGLVQLQGIIPEDYQKQLKPYHRQLNKRFWELEVMLYFKEFIDNWFEGNKRFVETVSREKNSIPFLRYKSKFVFERLQKRNMMPILSTPTHLPFYVHPDILIDRLQVYEQTNKNIDLEDLVVAANRIVKVMPSKNTLEKAKSLKGDYKFAIQYLLGVSDSIKLKGKILPLNKKLLPLWSQVCRTKEPDKSFPEFAKTPAKGIPSVVNPFYKDFRIQVETSDVWTWYRLKIADNWNNTRWYFDKKDKPKDYPVSYYYAAPHGLTSRADILYQISLLPHYSDAWLCRYLPDTASGNEVDGFEQCQYPLQALLDYKLKVYHSGWLYIAQCLIFEKKISRELAAEYILFSINNDTINRELLAKSIGVMIANKYAPVKRLTDYVEKPGQPKTVKELQLIILLNCILQGQPGYLPNSFKKIVTLYGELLKELKMKEDPTITEKLKSLKK